MDEEKIARWRERGALIQKDKERFIIRMGFTGGTVTSARMQEVAGLAQRFGGTLHLTTRQTVEIQNIVAANVDELLDEMQRCGISYAAVGPRLRTVVACPGDPVCRFSAGDTQQLASAIQERFCTFTGLQTKFKVSITGCRNSCAKPQENDLGIMADGKRGYLVFVGGRIGRTPCLGFELDRVLPDASEVLAFMERVLTWLVSNGQKKERLGAAISRVGRQVFLQGVSAS